MYYFVFVLFYLGGVVNFVGKLYIDFGGWFGEGEEVWLDLGLCRWFEFGVCKSV